jgi:recombinational DNA repair protein RecT
MSQKLQLTKAMLDSAANAKEILELEPVKDNWISIFNRSTGSLDGDKRYIAEQILFMNNLVSSPKLQKVDKASIYGAWIELSISGLTLRDGLTYIVPFKGKAQFMVGWKGRLEQINELPNVEYVHEPQVVYDCDDFEYEKGANVTIKKHKPGTRVKESKITHVYLAIDFKHATRVYIMDAVDVYSIRDRYSESFKYYKSRGGKWDDGNPMDEPMWISDEAQAFKKTIVKRVYNTLPKLTKHRMLDEKQNKVVGVEHDAEDLVETTTTDLSEKEFTDFTEIPDDESGDEKSENNELANTNNTKRDDNVSADRKTVDSKKNKAANKNKKPEPSGEDDNEAIPVDEGF